MDIPIFLLLCQAFLAYGDIPFGPDNGFRLTASKTFFVPNDNVTFTCTKGASDNSNDDNNPRTLVFGKSAGITWERNGQSLFSTTREGKECHVRPKTVLGRAAVTQSDLEAVKCTEDDKSVRVTIRNVTVSSTGDRWVCSKFPFLESNSVSLHNFVALSDVTLSLQDHFPNDISTGILMTLVCQASPCNPRPSVTWRLVSRDGHVLPLPSQSRTRSQVDRYGRVVLTTEVALAADHVYENATASCSATNALKASKVSGVSGDDHHDDHDGDADAWVKSETVTLTVKRPPRILLTISPANEVTEGTMVTLTCGAHGHPRPEVRWGKEGGFLPGGLMEAQTPIIRLNPARAPDQGQYTCRAFNGVAPQAVNSVYLTVKEPVRELKVSDKDRSTAVTEKKEPTRDEAEKTKPKHNNSNHDGDNGDDNVDSKAGASASTLPQNDDNNNDDGGGSNGGTIAAIVISVLVVLGGVALLLLWLLTRRRKQSLASPGSIASLFSHYPDRAMTAPKVGMYAPRPSQRPTTLSLDSFPQYLELPPAPSPPVGILNRGYGMANGSRVVNGKSGRPLPAAPAITGGDATANPLTYGGYDEIRDVIRDERRGGTTSSDGYEVPVLPEEQEDDDEEWDEEEEEEEGGDRIYDVPRPNSSPREPRALSVQGRGGSSKYMNEDSFNTHM